MTNSRLGRDFWLYRVAQFLSTIGDNIGNIALAWYFLERTKQILMLTHCPWDIFCVRVDLQCSGFTKSPNKRVRNALLLLDLLYRAFHGG